MKIWMVIGRRARGTLNLTNTVGRLLFVLLCLAAIGALLTRVG